LERIMSDLSIANRAYTPPTSFNQQATPVVQRAATAAPADVAAVIEPDGDEGFSGPYDADPSQAQQDLQIAQNTIESLKKLVELAQEPSQTQGGQTGSYASAGLGLLSNLTQNKDLGKAAEVTGGLDQIYTSHLPENAKVDGTREWGSAAGGLAAIGALTNDDSVRLASEATNGVLGVIGQSNPTAAWANGVGSGLSVTGKLIGGDVGKAMDIGASAAQTVSSIATNSVSNIVGGGAGLIGQIIGGETGQKISSVGSLASGALMMAANPILGALGVISGLLGLGGSPRTSKLSEQMSADFTGSGQMNDALTRAPGGDKNTLKVELLDAKTGKPAEAQQIKIPGYFDDKSQSRQQTTVDVNNDGKMDIVWQDKNKVSVFLNRGDGTFGNAKFTSQRKEIEDKGRSVEDTAGLIDLLGGTGLHRGGFLGIGSSTDNSKGQEALKKVWQAQGGESRLGKLETWRDAFVKKNNLADLKKQFDKSGGATLNGSFSAMVARRLATQGIQVGADLKLIDGHLKANNRDNLDTWMQGKRDGPGGTRGLQEMVPGLIAKSLEAHDEAHLGTGDKESQKPSGRFGASNVPRSDSASKDAMKDGSGVSLRTQTMNVNVAAQQPGQLQFADVNGDQRIDMVFSGEGVEGSKAFLNQGGGVFSAQGIDLPAQQLTAKA
jgi:FG-GAP-like repeat